MHGGGADQRIVGHWQVGRVEDERPRLRATEPAVEGDQLLERTAFLEDGVVEAVEEHVRCVLEAVGTPQVPGGVRREPTERVVSLDMAVREAARATRTEDDA